MEDTARDNRFCLVAGPARALGARLANAAVRVVVLHADTSEAVARLGPLLFEVRRALEPGGIALVLCGRTDLLPLAALGARSGFDAEPPCLWHTARGPRWLVPLRRRAGKEGAILPLIACDEDEAEIDAWKATLKALGGEEGAGCGWVVELDAPDHAFAAAAFDADLSWLGNDLPASDPEATPLREMLEDVGLRATSAVSGVLHEATLMARPLGLPQLFAPSELTSRAPSPKRPRRRDQALTPRLPTLDATGTD